VCKDGSVQAEPAVIEPEKDDFETPKEIVAENTRIDEMINGGANKDEELVVVHKLVKRYYKAPPAGQNNENVEARPTFQTEEGDNEEENKQG